MLDVIKADFKRYYWMSYGESTVTLSKKLRVWFNGYGLQVLVAQRFYRWSLKKENTHWLNYKLPLIPISFLLFKIAEQLYDIKISPHAVVGPGCYIGHFGGIRIGRCQIGKLCNINHQVKIGSFSDEDADRQVLIAERVWIGSHSKIMEGAQIGVGVTISAGTTVTLNVPDKVLVAGPFARALKHNYNNTALLCLEE